MAVSGDLICLFKDCGFQPEHDIPFSGAVNHGQYEKLWNAAPKASVGLADLTVNVLRHHLSKDPAICVSMDWDTPHLTDAQINYVSLDVYAAWAIYNTLSSISAGTPINHNAPGGTPVSLYGPDLSHVVAQGHIAMERPKDHLGVALTPHRVLVPITTVLNPGHIVPWALLGTKSSPAQDTPLLAMPSPPFTLVCVCTQVNSGAALIPSSSISSTIQHSLAALIPSQGSAASYAEDDASNPDAGTSCTQNPANEWHHDTDAILNSEQVLANSQPDPEGMVQLSYLSI